MAEFKAGDLVSLKSGGPIMTVDSVERGFGSVVCVWFAGAKRESAHFKTDSIEAAEKPVKK